MAPTSNPSATGGTSAVLPARFWLPLVVAAAVSGATLVVSELSYRSFTDDVADLGKGFELHARLLELEKTVAEAEAAQRGYLLSRGLGDLEAFQRSVNAIPAIQQRDPRPRLPGQGGARPARGPRPVPWRSRSTRCSAA